MKNENGSPISFFYCKEKRKTKSENKICVSFSYTIESRLALRYTDCFFLMQVLLLQLIIARRISDPPQPHLHKFFW